MESYGKLSTNASLLVIGLSLANASFGGDWTTEAGMAVGGVYSDNICLAHDDKEGKWVATATPDLRVTGEGAQANMDLMMALEFNSLAESSLECPGGGALGLGTKNAIAPRLRFTGDAVLVENWLYFDANAFADQNKINSFGVGGGDNINGRGNTNTVFSYRVSPYIDRRIGDTGNFLLRYSYADFINSESIVNDSTNQSVLLDLGTNPELTRFSMGVTGNYSRVDYDENLSQNTANNELSSARIRTAFQVNAQWQVNASVGEEWNDFISVFDDTEGTFWDAGLLWTPNERVSVAIGTGDRFFGSTPRFDVQYSHKRSLIRASYLRDVTYEQNLRSTDQFADDIDGLLDETVPPAGDAQATAGAPTTLTNAPILDERFTLVYSFSGRRTSVNLNVSHSEQTRAEDGFKDTFINAGVSFRRDLSTKLSFNSSLYWEDRQGDEQRGVLGRDSDTWRLLFGLRRDLGTNTSVFMSYQYSERSSEIIQDEYDESRLTFSFRYQF